MKRMWGVKKIFSFMFIALMVSVLLAACGGGGGGSDGGNNGGGGGSAPSAPQNIQATAADG